MNTLNFKQVIENIKAGETYEPTDKSIYLIQAIRMDKAGEIQIEFSKAINQYYTADVPFIKKKKPLTFDQVLKSNKKFLFKYETDREYITEVIKNSCLNTNEEDIISAHKKFCRNEYLSMDEFFLLAGYILTPATLKEALEKGSFYIQE